MADNREQVKDRPELPWDDSFGDHIRILDNVLDLSLIHISEPTRPY